MGAPVGTKPTTRVTDATWNLGANPPPPAATPSGGAVRGHTLVAGGSSPLVSHP